MPHSGQFIEPPNRRPGQPGPTHSDAPVITPGPPPTPSVTVRGATGLEHFVAPFALGADGKPLVCAQDSPQDIASSVYNIVVCPQGAKLSDPGFGIPDPLFHTIPLDTSQIQTAIEAQEPRAEISITQIDQTTQIEPGLLLGDTTLLLDTTFLNDTQIIVAGAGQGTVSLLVDVGASTTVAN